MHELNLVRLLGKLPVFSLADVSKIVKSRNYSKKILARLVKNKTVYKIMRDRYSLQDLPFIVAPFLKVPSYISCASALSYHGLISQIPNAVFLMTKKRPATIEFLESKMEYHFTKHFFGFITEKFNEFRVPVAEPEKAFIDSIGIHPLQVVMEAFDELDKKKLLVYAKKMHEEKRIGFLLEKNGEGFEQKKVSYKNVFLDPLGPKKGELNTKWKLTVNY